MQETIVNRVADSGIVTLNPEDFFPKEEIVVFDIKDYLFKGLILKEKDFRESLSAHDWEKYKDKNVAINCSADAIIPMWAYMLVTSYLQPFAKEIIFGTKEMIINALLQKNINALDAASFSDKKVVIKGCGNKPVPESAYLLLTAKLRPYVKSIMYGEPCSTVPIYKKK